MNQHTSKPQNKYIQISVIFCVCFLAGSILFVSRMMNENEKDNRQFINNAAKQIQVSLSKQIQGDFQTLEGISVTIGHSGDIDNASILSILTKINEKNTFIRMGFADVQGNLSLVDIDGKTHVLNIQNQDFFQHALLGKETISEFFEDSFDPDQLINYYGIPVYNDAHQVKGVLCAVNSEKLIREIISVPLFNKSGYSDILNLEGNIVIRSDNSTEDNSSLQNIKQLKGIDEEEQKTVRHALTNGSHTTFTYKVNQKEYMAVLQPVIANRWFVISVLPKSVLQQRYLMTAYGIVGIILISSAAFLIFMIQQRRAIIKNNLKMMEFAYQDQVTGMRSYSKFLLDAEEFMKTDHADTFVIWYCDMKKFKYLNDVLGYRVGNDILKGLAEIFKKQCEDQPFCRISGDYYTGIMRYQDKPSLLAWYERILDALSERRIQINTQLDIELCFGFYLTKSDNEMMINDMVNRASMAQKAIKMKPGSSYQFYDEALRKKTLADSLVISEGKQALQKEEFVMFFQPKVNIQQQDTIYGAEVLARWNHPEHGILPPSAFIPQLEASGMIVDLDRYMFAHACAWLRNYLDEGNRINLAVNVSRLGILRNDFVEYYTQIKDKYQIPDGLLELEFTESILFGQYELFQTIVGQLHEQGFICSMDDFGSGYSSLNTLKNLPIDTLKLDLEFFKNSLSKKKEQIIVTSVLSMAKQLKVKTIAEGVENEDTLNFLKMSSCNLVQGYIFSKPLPQSEFEKMLHYHRNHPVPLSK